MSNIKVLEKTRGHVVIQLGERSMKIQGEMLMPGKVNYVIYGDTIKRWLPPHSDLAVTTADKKQIVAALLQWGQENNYKFDIENPP